MFILKFYIITSNTFCVPKCRKVHHRRQFYVKNTFYFTCKEHFIIIFFTIIIIFYFSKTYVNIPIIGYLFSHQIKQISFLIFTSSRKLLLASIFYENDPHFRSKVEPTHVIITVIGLNFMFSCL